MASLIAIAFALATLGTLPAALAGLVMALLLLAVSGLPARVAAGRLRWPLIFILPICLVLPFTTEGGATIHVLGWAFSLQGAEMGLLMLVKGVAVVISALAMLASAPFSVHAMALRELKFPDHLVQILLFTHRYIFVIGRDLESTYRSMVSRGFESKTGYQTAKVMGNVLGVLMIKSLDRSDRIYLAMSARGYFGRLARVGQESMKGTDWIKALLVGGSALGLHLWEAMPWIMP